jgi:hypothetical protein
MSSWALIGDQRSEGSAASRPFVLLGSPKIPFTALAARRRPNNTRNRREVPGRPVCIAIPRNIKFLPGSVKAMGQHDVVRFVAASSYHISASRSIKSACSLHQVAPNRELECPQWLLCLVGRRWSPEESLTVNGLVQEHHRSETRGHVLAWARRFCPWNGRAPMASNESFWHFSAQPSVCSS